MPEKILAEFSTCVASRAILSCAADHPRLSPEL